MFSKKNILLGAKISFCAMLMLLTAGVANASLAGDFVFNPIGSNTVSGGSTDNLALEFIMPDGTSNSGVTDTLRHDGATDSWSGDTLTAFSAVQYYLDDDYNTTWDWFTPEAIWVDVNTNSMIETGEIELPGTADLETFNAAGTTYWVADSFATDVPPGLAGGSYTSADFDTTEAIFEDTDGSSFLGDGDNLIKNGTAGVINFTSAAINPGGVCAAPGVGGCNGNANIDNFYFCDGIVGGAPNPPTLNGLFDIGETVYADLLGGNPLDYDPGDLLLSDQGGSLNGLGSCTGPGGVLVSLTAAPQQLVFLDADKTGLYGDSAVFGAGAVAPFSPWGEPLIYLSTVPIGDFGVLATTNFGQILPAALHISPATPDYVVFDAIPMHLAGGGNLRFLGFSAAANPYLGTQVITDESLGVIAGQLESAEIIEPAFAGGTLNQNFTPVHKYVDDGDGLFEIAEDIYDESTGVIAAQVETGPDQLDDITLQNAGTMLNTDIAAINLWADVGILGTFEPLADTLVGTGVWDGADSWDFTGLAFPISGMSPGGNNYFVSVDLVASPQGGKTVELFIPLLIDGATLGAFDAGEEGVFVISSNDGPVGANAVPATTNRLITPGSGGGGTGGGSSVGSCGDGILDTLESCDDGNRTNGDGCNAYCSLEDGYVWDADTETVMTEEDAEAAGVEVPEEEETTTETEATPEDVTEETLDEVSVEEVASEFSDYDSTHWAAEYIAKLFLANIMTGYGDGDTFGIAMGTTRAEIVKIALLANGVEVPESVDEAPFFDTPAGEWYTPYIAKAVNLGIVEGYDDGNFRPGNMVNRAEALKILLLAKGIDLEGYDLSSAASFDDVSEAIWYAVYVAYAVDMNLIEGYEDGTFKGGNDILRAEIAKLTVMIMLLEMVEEAV